MNTNSNKDANTSPAGTASATAKASEIVARTVDGLAPGELADFAPPQDAPSWVRMPTKAAGPRGVTAARRAGKVAPLSCALPGEGGGAQLGVDSGAIAVIAPFARSWCASQFVTYSGVVSYSRPSAGFDSNQKNREEPSCDCPTLLKRPKVVVQLLHVAYSGIDYLFAGNLLDCPFRHTSSRSHLAPSVLGGFEISQNVGVHRFKHSPDYGPSLGSGQPALGFKFGANLI